MYLKSLQIKSIDILNIAIICKDEFITVKANDFILLNKKSNFEISKQDIFFLKNNILYLIQDDLFIDEDRIKLNINI